MTYVRRSDGAEVYIADIAWQALRAVEERGTPFYWERVSLLLQSWRCEPHKWRIDAQSGKYVDRPDTPAKDATLEKVDEALERALVEMRRAARTQDDAVAISQCETDLARARAGLRPLTLDSFR